MRLWGRRSHWLALTLDGCGWSRTRKQTSKNRIHHLLLATPRSVCSHTFFNILNVHKLNHVTWAFLLLDHACCKQDDFWPLVDRQSLVLKREFVMLSASTVCLSFHLLHIDPTPTQSCSPTASWCSMSAEGPDLLQLSGQNLFLSQIFPETGNWI